MFLVVCRLVSCAFAGAWCARVSHAESSYGGERDEDGSYTEEETEGEAAKGEDEATGCEWGDDYVYDDEEEIEGEEEMLAALNSGSEEEVEERRQLVISLVGEYVCGARGAGEVQKEIRTLAPSSSSTSKYWTEDEWLEIVMRTLRIGWCLEGGCSCETGCPTCWEAMPEIMTKVFA